MFFIFVVNFGVSLGINDAEQGQPSKEEEVAFEVGGKRVPGGVVASFSGVVVLVGHIVHVQEGGKDTKGEGVGLEVDGEDQKESEEWVGRKTISIGKFGVERGIEIMMNPSPWGSHASLVFKGHQHIKVHKEVGKRESQGLDHSTKGKEKDGVKGSEEGLVEEAQSKIGAGNTKRAVVEDAMNPLDGVHPLHELGAEGWGGIRDGEFGD